MIKRIPGMPGAFAHFLCILLAMVTALCMLLTAVTGLTHFLISSTGLHERVALSPPVHDAQRQRIDEAVSTLAAQYSFDPACVNPLLSDEAIAQYNRDVIAWWTGLFGSTPTVQAPTFSSAELMDAVLADEAFRAATPSGRRKAIARDDIAATLAEQVEQSVLPLRTSLISLALTQLFQRVQLARYTAFLPLLPWLFALLSAFGAALMVLCMHCRPMRALPYIGRALSAAGLCLLLALAVLHAANLPAFVGQVSAMAALQLSTLFTCLRPVVWGIAALITLAGLLPIGIHQHAMLHLRRSLAAKGVPA